MTRDIILAQTDAEIQACFPVFKVLRPHLSEENFLAQIRRQQTQGYQILTLVKDGVIRSAAGYRMAEFLAWGKILYIDDLITLPQELKRGYASALLDRLIDYAQSQQCDGLHLDSGYARHDAHRLYLNKGLQLGSHHLFIKFSK
jgi:GNAT superfamily N-acetyltransferase